MSIYRVNTNLSTLKKVRSLNDMILELNGKISKGQFDINEILQMIADAGMDRKFLRNQAIGNTTSTYTEWSHLKAEVGYSIWKLTPSNYTYNSVNELYSNNVILSNKGEADSESATAFDLVYSFDGDSGSTYVDNTTEAGTESGVAFNTMNSTTDYLYLGHSTTFAGAKFEWQTRGSGHAIVVEYYSDESGVNDWVTLAANGDNLSDNTGNFTSDGRITWDIPVNWGTTSVNSQSKYWIRISTSSTPTTIATALMIVPGDSVISLLALSSSEIQNEDWAWCTYSGSIYATIRNDGNTSYEGNYYITSASSSTNLQNYFVYNKPFTANHEDSTYDPVKTITVNTELTGNEDLVLLDGTNNAVIAILPTASSVEGLEITIKNINVTYATSYETQSGETIDGAGSQSLSSQYDFDTVKSDGTNWHIIASS